MTLPRAYKLQSDYFEKLRTNNITIICERPGLFIVRNYGALGFRYAARNSNLVLRHLKEMYYEHLFVVQSILYETNKPAPAEELPQEYQLRPLYELRSSTFSFTRISEVVRPSAAVPAEAALSKKEKTGK
jgi:hypothetical protein